jgi:metallo-beta-lactamase family protein
MMLPRSSSTASTPRVTFWGAAGTVTGSMHLVEVAGDQVLLDCGLFLERRGDTPERNRHFPFDPYRLRAVVLSHAHIDHCGNLPNLVRQGFAGPIYCTPPTRDLLELMLVDSARIHEEDTLQANIVRSADTPWVAPLYSRDDALHTLELCVPIPYERPQAIGAHVQCRLVDAGHVLGSAMVALTVNCRGHEQTLTFTGDLGRPGMALQRDPAPLPPADLVICECTYGGTSHAPIAAVIESLRNLVRETVARGGKVLIPAFSLGRCQLVVHYLQQLMRSGQAPAVPIFVDSPLASNISGVYRRHLDYLAAGASVAGDLFDGPLLHYVRAIEESRQLSARREPCVIVASGGMCEGGRILHHLKHNVDDPRSSVVLVSYQAPDTLGARLLERRPTVRFHGRDWNKWIDVLQLRGFSGHADHDDLLRALAPLTSRAPTVRLVHGEPAAAAALGNDLRARNFANVVPARYGETVELVSV